jgi:cobalt/nickel transport system permease protein
MRHDFIDRFSRLSSPIHRWATSAKLTGAIAMVVAIVATPIQVSVLFVLIGIFLVVIAALSRIPAGFLLKRLLFLEPFVFSIAVLTLLQPNGEIVFVSIVVKSTLALFTMVVLSNTSPFAEILGVLRRIGIPPLFITVLALMYRYLFVLIDEAERMQRARLSRTFRRNRLQRWHMLATLAGELFVRSTERAERIYAAMCARGWK